jgi:opacity protein-like surface antigen
MKTIFLSIAFCFLIQTSEAQLIRSYGIKTGAVIAGQDWKYSSLGFTVADKMRWGFDFGCFVEWLNIPTVSIVSELHYVQKGFKEEVNVTTAASPDVVGTKELTPRVDYLSIPLLVKCRMDLPSFSPYVIVGPRYDVLITTKPEGFDVVLNHLRKSDIGITFGGGFECSIMPEVLLGMEYRYSMSLDDVYSTEVLKVRNRSMEFLLFVGF